ncbi:DUF4153 domain-containing protein [Cohnella terricola]|uniref:DUF4173 domain-containing protein n=1 Tax=Cohnella terricola TaxID=1289167 RepID=A0A559JIL4_9BACL|nr:DUF4173 domain-containing protein [Cohnella terricola]TVX99716.1 DUF4173 domain-containing protein [Cohnella terricola]
MNTLRKAATGSPLVALIGAFALAVGHQYLFYGHVPGVSFPLFVILLYIYLFHDWRARLGEITGIGWFLAAVILLLSLTFALFHNPVFRALNLLVVPALVFVHLAYVRGANRVAWWDYRIVGEAWRHLVPQSLRHVPTIFRLMKIALFRKLGANRKATANKVAIGLVAAAPLLVIVVALLASADGAFNRVLNGIPEWGSRIFIGEGLARGIWIIGLGVLFFGYFRGFAKPRRIRSNVFVQEDAPIGGARIAKAGIDPVILATVLVSVNAVYLLFVAVQFGYLFGAWDGQLPDGTTYAEYARRGFTELVAVTAINFVLLMTALVYGGQLKRFIAALLYILTLSSGVMLFSAYIRLAMYEEAYGYTYIRFLVHAFMIYLAILLLIAALRIRMPVIPMAKCYVVLSLAAYVVINYVGMDRIIAEQNIDRFEETGRIDRPYLSGLAPEAIPRLVRFSKDNKDEEMIGLLDNRRADLALEDRDWRSFNVSVISAEKALNELYEH